MQQIVWSQEFIWKNGWSKLLVCVAGVRLSWCWYTIYSSGNWRRTDRCGVITARKRSLGQGYIFTGVCHSVNGGGGLPGRHPCQVDTPHRGDPLPPVPGRPPARETPLPGRTHQGDPPARETPHQGDPLPGRPPCQGDPPARETPPLPGRPPGPHPGGKLRGIKSRTTPKGEIEVDQIQALAQGGNWGGSDPGPHPRGNWGGSDPGPRPRGKLRGIRSRPTLKGEIQGDQDQTPPPPPMTTTAVGGTHPTGMHSCLTIFFNGQLGYYCTKPDSLRLRQFW